MCVCLPGNELTKWICCITFQFEIGNDTRWAGTDQDLVKMVLKMRRDGETLEEVKIQHVSTAAHVLKCTSL